MQDSQYDAYLYRFNPLNDLIIDGVHKLVIEVIPLETEPEIDRSQVHYYGDDYGYPLLFQTVKDSRPDGSGDPGGNFMVRRTAA